MTFALPLTSVRPYSCQTMSSARRLSTMAQFRLTNQVDPADPFLLRLGPDHPRPPAQRVPPRRWYSRALQPARAFTRAWVGRRQTSTSSPRWRSAQSDRGLCRGLPRLPPGVREDLRDQAGSSPIRLPDVRAVAPLVEAELDGSGFVSGRSAAITGAGGIRKEALVDWVRATSEPGSSAPLPGSRRRHARGGDCPSRSNPKECATWLLNSPP